jgi:hypothetical protein
MPGARTLDAGAVEVGREHLHRTRRPDSSRYSRNVIAIE